VKAISPDNENGEDEDQGEIVIINPVTGNITDFIDDEVVSQGAVGISLYYDMDRIGDTQYQDPRRWFTTTISRTIREITYKHEGGAPSDDYENDEGSSVSLTSTTAIAVMVCSVFFCGVFLSVGVQMYQKRSRPKVCYGDVDDVRELSFSLSESLIPPGKGAKNLRCNPIEIVAYLWSATFLVYLYSSVANAYPHPKLPC
jgi:hypothetical protein